MAINYKKIGSKIKNFRLRKRLTQETLAELCGLSSSYISYVETGKKKISLSKLEQISECLNFDVDIVDNEKISNKNIFLNRLIDVIKSEFQGNYPDW